MPVLIALPSALLVQPLVFLLPTLCQPTDVAAARRVPRHTLIAFK